MKDFSEGKVFVISPDRIKKNVLLDSPPTNETKIGSADDDDLPEQIPDHEKEEEDKINEVEKHRREAD